jgi:hypothetical protein
MERTKLSGTKAINSLISIAEIKGAVDITTVDLQRRVQAMDANALMKEARRQQHEMSQRHKAKIAAMYANKAKP